MGNWAVVFTSAPQVRDKERQKKTAAAAIAAAATQLPPKQAQDARRLRIPKAENEASDKTQPQACAKCMRKNKSERNSTCVMKLSGRVVGRKRNVVSRQELAGLHCVIHSHEDMSGRKPGHASARKENHL